MWENILSLYKVALDSYSLSVHTSVSLPHSKYLSKIPHSQYLLLKYLLCNQHKYCLFPKTRRTYFLFPISFGLLDGFFSIHSRCFFSFQFPKCMTILPSLSYKIKQKSVNWNNLFTIGLDIIWQTAVDLLIPKSAFFHIISFRNCNVNLIIWSSLYRSAIMINVIFFLIYHLYSNFSSPKNPKQWTFLMK